MLALMTVKRHGKGVSERGEKVGGRFAPTAVADSPAGAGAGLSLSGEGRADSGRAWEVMNRPGVSHTRVSSLALRIKDSAEAALRGADPAGSETARRIIAGVCVDAYRAELRGLLRQDDKSAVLVRVAEDVEQRGFNAAADERGFIAAAAACWDEPPEKYGAAVVNWKEAFDESRAVSFQDDRDKYWEAQDRFREIESRHRESARATWEFLDKVDETREALHWIGVAGFEDEDTVDLEGAIYRHYQNATGEPESEAVRALIAADVNAFRDIAAAGAAAGGLEDIAAAVDKVGAASRSERARVAADLTRPGLSNEHEAAETDDEGESFDSRIKTKIVERGHLTAEELDDSKGRGRTRFMLAYPDLTRPEG